MARRRMMEETPAAPFVDPRQQPMFEERGITFITCSCGLKASVEVFRKHQGKCPGCDRVTALPEPATEPQTPSTPKKSESQEKPEKDKTPHEANPTKLCDTCKKPLAETSLGFFYSCGHDPRRSAPKDAPEPAQREESPPPKAVAETAPRRRQMAAPKGEIAPLVLPTVEPPKGHPDMSLQTTGSSNGDSVTVSWGKELYSPVKFHTWEVGPFSITTIRKSGESMGDALGRAMNELREFAEIERARKYESYQRMVAHTNPKG